MSATVFSNTYKGRKNFAVTDKKNSKYQLTLILHQSKIDIPVTTCNEFLSSLEEAL